MTICWEPDGIVIVEPTALGAVVIGTRPGVGFVPTMKAVFPSGVTRTPNVLLLRPEIDAVTVFVAVEITLTGLPVTYRILPSGETARPRPLFDAEFGIGVPAVFVRVL